MVLVEDIRTLLTPEPTVPPGVLHGIQCLVEDSACWSLVRLGAVGDVRGVAVGSCDYDAQMQHCHLPANFSWCFDSNIVKPGYPSGIRSLGAVPPPSPFIMCNRSSVMSRGECSRVIVGQQCLEGFLMSYPPDFPIWNYRDVTTGPGLSKDCPPDVPALFLYVYIVMISLMPMTLPDKREGGARDKGHRHSLLTSSDRTSLGPLLS